MSLFYKVAYRLGFTPWEEASGDDETAAKVSEWFDREESGRDVDMVPMALSTARERAHEAGVEVRLLQGDVTSLRAAGVGDGFRLVWDFGTVHGLTPAQRQAVGREVSAVAAPDASVVMLAWTPGRRGPLPRGASRADIEAAYAGWKVTDEDAADVSGPNVPRPVRNAKPRWYRLVRA